jgi:hypothetical protein
MDERTAHERDAIDTPEVIILQPAIVGFPEGAPVRSRRSQMNRRVEVAGMALLFRSLGLL